MQIKQARIARTGTGAKLMMMVTGIPAPPVALDTVTGWSLDYAYHDLSSETAQLCFSRGTFDPPDPAEASRLLEVTLVEIEGILALQE